MPIALLGMVLTSPASAVELCYPSGLRIVLQERPGRSEIAIATVVDGGSSAEEAGEHGAAHLLEHLWFQSPQLGYATVNNALADLGAEANAYTTLDETLYVTLAARSTIGKLLALEAARIADPLAGVGPERVALEKSVVVSEVIERTDGLGSFSSPIFNRLFPPSHAYTRPIAGTTAEVASLDAAAMRSYADRQYHPSATTVYVTGDFKPEELAARVSEAFPAELTGGAASRLCVREPRIPPALSPPPQHEPWEKQVADVIEDVALFGWRAPPGPDTLDRVERIAVLMALWLEDSGVDVNCWAETYFQANFMICSALAEQGQAPAAVHRFAANPESLWGKLDSARGRRLLGTMGWIVQQWTRSELIDMERVGVTPYGYPIAYAVDFHRRRDAEYPLRSSRTPPATADLIDFARQFTGDTVRSVILTPPETLGSIAIGHADRVVDLALTRDPETVTEDSLLEWIDAPKLGELSIWELANGTRVWHLAQDGLNQPRVAVVFDPTEAFFTDPLLVDSMFDRIANPTWLAMQAGIRGVGIDGQILGAYNTDNQWVWHGDSGSVTWSMTALASVLQRTDVLRSKRVIQKEWSAFERDIEVWQDNPQIHASVLRWKRFAPDLPFGLLDAGERERVAKVSPAAARDLIRSVVRPDRATVLIIGPADDDLKDATNEIFGTWTGETSSGPRARAPRTDSVSVPKPQIWVLASRRPQRQAEIILDCRIDGAESTGGLLTAHLSSALNDVLREQRGMTYGVDTARLSTAHGGVLRIRSDVPPDRAGEAIDAIFDALRTPIPADRLAQLKVETARNTVGTFQTGDDYLALLAWWVSIRDDDQDRPGLAKILADTTPESLHQSLSKCAGHEVVTVIGDARTIGTSLDDAALPWARHPWQK